MTDYEKSKEECWKELCVHHRKYGETTKEAFEHTFKQAYRYGRMCGMEEAKASDSTVPSIEQQVAHCMTKQLYALFAGNDIRIQPSLRFEATKAAMQGILSSNIILTGAVEIENRTGLSTNNQIVAMAVSLADALLAKLDKTEESGN